MPTLNERVSTLKRAGFRISKYRTLKSGEQYKIFMPKALNAIHPVYYTRIGLGNAVEFAEGMTKVWEVVQQELAKDIAGIAGKYGVSLRK